MQTKNYKKIRKALDKKGFKLIEAVEWRKSIRLTGVVKKWDDKIEAGFAVANKGYKGVINDIGVDGITPETMPIPDYSDTYLENKHFDVIIIGGGITGAAIARELSRNDISIALFEKEEDLARHASGRNDGVVHDGFAAKPGTKKAEYNVRGNRAYTKVTEELDVDFFRPGSFLLLSSPFSKLLIPFLKSRAKKNDVDGYEYLSRKTVAKREPNLTKKQYGAFFLPSGGVMSPYKMVIAYAENASKNGAEICFNTAVTGFDLEGKRIARIKTNRGTCSAGVVINAAGIWADTIAEFADDRFFSLHGRKGADAILDIKTGEFQKTSAAMPPIISQKSSTSKGGGLVMTPEGNILVGPTAKEVPEREDYSTEPEDMDGLQHHIDLNTKLNRSQVITYFAGIRACNYEEDFIIEASEEVENLVYGAAIQSPGFASAPAIAEDIAAMTVEILGKEKTVAKNETFNPYRTAPPQLKSMPLEERAALIQKNPAYGRIVCRCEEISEGEIRDALRSPLSVTTIDGIKRRARVGAGRCHGGFCTPRVLEIMAEELDRPVEELTKKGKGSEVFFGLTKGTVDYSGKKLKTMKEEEAVQ